MKSEVFVVYAMREAVKLSGIYAVEKETQLNFPEGSGIFGRAQKYLSFR